MSPVTFRKFSFAAGFATALLAYALPADAQGIGLLRDTETEEMLKSYEAPLARAAGLDPNSVKTHLVGDPSLNAFAMQPANIFICAGMLLWLRTPNELIGVMAHETGHISGAHLTRGSFGAKKAMIPMLASLVIGLGAMLAGAGELGMVMMGLGRFFDDFRSPAVVEDLLADDADALAGLQQVIDRGFRAAGFALGFAVHRLDTDAEVIQEAAMLHDFAEMLLWCRAPALARRIRDRQAADPALRSAQAQLEVLNIRLQDLQRALMQAWHLPELLAQITDREHLDNPQVRNVVLAVDIARHTQLGWDNPAVPDDLTEIGRLLNLTPESARRKVMGLDA